MRKAVAVKNILIFIYNDGNTYQQRDGRREDSMTEGVCPIERKDFLDNSYETGHFLRK